jgi:hypothetical protein
MNQIEILGFKKLFLHLIRPTKHDIPPTDVQNKKINPGETLKKKNNRCKIENIKDNF